MMSSQRIFLVAAALLVLGICASSGCNLVLGIHDLSETSSDPDGGTPCNVVGQCDDLNPCTIDSCVAGACSHADQPDGPAPNAAQTAFDCKVVQCSKGVPDVQNDDTDIQVDSEDCTNDGCNGGIAFHTAKADGTVCKMGGNGLCELGKCQIGCVHDSECDDKNPCTNDACDLAQSICAFAPLNGVNTPGAAQIDFDCNVQVCVDGVDTKSPDDSDLPKTPTDCDQELCSGGVPSNPPLDLDVSCGLAKDKFCDGMGACVACNYPAQCPGIDNDCQARSCTAGACGISFSAAGTPRAAPFQTAGDCNLVVCDGAGSSAAPQSDDTDLPPDGNACTKDVCTNGVISHPFEAANTACGNNSACNAVGQCGCANDAACAAPNTCGGGSPGTAFICGCTLKTCASVGKTCGTVSDGCFSTQSCDNGSKEGTETDIDCGGGAAGSCGTTCAAGKQCNVDTDCGTGHCADGVCCNSACTGTCQACSAAKKGGGSDGTCGSILLGLQDANATSTCLGNNACDGANHCKKIDGQSCSLNSECVNGSCADGVCCNTSCTGTCLACSALKKGGGADGVCGNIAQNLQDAAAIVTCTGTNACDGGGVCKKSLGQVCASNGICANGNCIDGVCCGAGGGCPACQSCAVGANGTCGNIADGSQDTVTPNTCMGANVCIGGNCKSVNGQPCVGGGTCQSNICADSVCCGTICGAAAVCMTCNGATPGTCTPVTSADDPDSCNAATKTCDAAGACLLKPGQLCTVGAQCASNLCNPGMMTCQ